MRHAVVTVLALSALAASLPAPTRATATDRDAALALCQANPNCMAQTAAGGSVHLFVGNNYVACPAYGQCECLYCGLPVPGSAAETGNPKLTTDVGALLQ